MTAISLDVPQPAAQFGRGQGSAPFSRAAALAASAAASTSISASPARHPGSFSRQTTLAMSHLQAQYAEASAAASAAMPPQPNGTGPHHARPSRLGQAQVQAETQGPPSMTHRRRKTSPIPSSSRRPSSAPSDNQGSPAANRPERPHIETDNGGPSSSAAVARLSKPPLLRSKSEHGPRPDETDDEEADEEHYDLGARHGFEDHYLSEDIIAQLANVSGNTSLFFQGRPSVVGRLVRPDPPEPRPRIVPMLIEGFRNPSLSLGIPLSYRVLVDGRVQSLLPSAIPIPCLAAKRVPASKIPQRWRQQRVTDSALELVHVLHRQTA